MSDDQKVVFMHFESSGKWCYGSTEPGEPEMAFFVRYDDYLHEVWRRAADTIRRQFGYGFYVIRTPGHPHDHPTLIKIEDSE